MILKYSSLHGVRCMVLIFLRSTGHSLTNQTRIAVTTRRVRTARQAQNSNNLPTPWNPTERCNQSILDKALTSDPSPTWRAMEKLHAEGKAKSIGVSNWTIAGLEAMKSYAKTMPAVNQCEVHPLLHNEKLLQYCKSNNIVLAAYSPLGGQMNGAPMFKNEKLQKLAEKKDCTVAQLLISWGLRRGYAVLPKSFTPSRIESNLKLVRLTDEEAEEVGKCSGGEEKRFCDMSDGKIWAESE